MARVLRPIGHEERLSLVDHLDELRTRLILCSAALAVAFAVCLWQNHELLHIINKPLQAQTKKQVAKGQGTVGQSVLAQQGVLKVAGEVRAALRLLAAPGSGLSAATRAQLGPLQTALGSDVRKIPRNPPGDNPVTLGVGEPFTTTLTVALYFAVLFAAPLILYELYGFMLRAPRGQGRRRGRTRRNPACSRYSITPTRTCRADAVRPPRTRPAPHGAGHLHHPGDHISARLRGSGRGRRLRQRRHL